MNTVMSINLRIGLIIISILFVIYVLYSVNRKKLQLQFSLIWLFLSFVLILVSLFPQIVYFLANLVGIEVSSNFVYLIGIISLSLISINLTSKVSKQSNQIKNIIQEISLSAYLNEENKKA